MICCSIFDDETDKSIKIKSQCNLNEIKMILYYLQQCFNDVYTSYGGNLDTIKLLLIEFYEFYEADKNEEIDEIIYLDENYEYGYYLFKNFYIEKEYYRKGMLDFIEQTAC
ncbi:MAG: hypothetical protein ACOCRK_02695 [bacterium]